MTTKHRTADDSEEARPMLPTSEKTRSAIQISSLSILVFLAGYVVLWADNHNDGRYLKKEDFTHYIEATEKARSVERASDARFVQEVSNSQEKRLVSVESKLDQILVLMYNKGNQPPVK